MRRGCAKMLRNHYNQQELQKHFARQEGKHYKLTLVDLKNKHIGSRNVETAFYEEGLYSDELERELNLKVEIPGMKVFDKVYNSERFVTLTRDELEKMKKYLLIQQYRNPTNISEYSPDWKGDVLGYNKTYEEGGQTYKEHVYEMMHHVLDHSWEELLYSEEEEVQHNARGINGTMTLFVRSGHEFVINDLGLVTERQVWNRYSQNPEFKKSLGDSLLSLVPNATDEQIEQYNQAHQWHDNYTFYPISSHSGVITIENLWVIMMKVRKAYSCDFNNGELVRSADPDFFRWMNDEIGLHSRFIQENFVPCIPDYRSDQLKNVTSEMELANVIDANKSQDDRFIYPVIDLSLKWTEYLNRLTINEADRYFAFGSNMDGRITIDNYEMCRILNSDAGFKQDLSWIQNIDDWTKPIN